MMIQIPPRKSSSSGQVKFTVVFLVILLLAAFKMYFNYLFDPTVYRNQWYTVKVPEGWNKHLQEDEVVFMSPDKNLYTQMPEAVFSIYAKKSTGALFIEDIMAQVMGSLARANGRVLKKGDVKIDGVVSRWILFQNEEPEMIILTFYIVDDFNRLFKIQFTSEPQKFKSYREVFEKFKDTIKFKKYF